MVLTDDEAAAVQGERQWARDLADKFAPTGRTTRGDQTEAKLRPTEATETDISSLEETLGRLSCASEFKYRKRHTWLYVLGCAVTLFTSVEFVLFAMGGRLTGINRESLSAWLILAGFNVLSWFLMWTRAMPICPNCKQNIRTCPAEHCHVCGKPLSHKRCADCGVDNSLTSWLRPNSNGSFHWITYCPGCGVELDTWIRRWRFDLSD